MWNRNIVTIIFCLVSLTSSYLEFKRCHYYLECFFLKYIFLKIVGWCRYVTGVIYACKQNSKLEYRLCVTASRNRVWPDEFPTEFTIWLVEDVSTAIFHVIYEQRERVFHRDIQTRENNVWKHEHEARVFSYIVFECLDIPVRHELELFIWLLKWIET
jgi:hypothetical protein